MRNSDPVKLRTRKNRSGKITIYLDIYIKGKRKFEYLHLYLLPDTDRETRRRNAETMRLARAVCAARLIEVQNGRFGFGTSLASTTNVHAYFRAKIDEKNVASAKTYLAMLGRLGQYDKALERKTFADISPEWIDSFQSYLLRNVRRNTAAQYIVLLRHLVKIANRDGVIDWTYHGTLRSQTGEREYLTAEEVSRLAATHCRFPQLKRAFLFSCLTGLRLSDIITLQWCNVSLEERRISFSQRKTGEKTYIELNDDAVTLLTDDVEEVRDGAVFKLGVHRNSISKPILDWARAAGIEKHITFHSARHTFATLLLTSGADIYTASKLLGHRNVRTTQIYARIVDEKRREAVDNLPRIL